MGACRVVSTSVFQVERSDGRVRVSVTILDHQTAALLDEVGRDALILEEPLLRWLE
jgi:hypothetical protein